MDAGEDEYEIVEQKVELELSDSDALGEVEPAARQVCDKSSESSA